MPCIHTDGAIICVRGGRKPKKCYWCSKPGTLLCDGKFDGAKKTCDAPMCPDHATDLGMDRHLCPKCTAIAAGKGMTFR